MNGYRKFASFVYKAHIFLSKWQKSKFLFVQALGGMGINFLMGYTYVKVLKDGEKWQRSNVKHATRQSASQKKPVPPVA